MEKIIVIIFKYVFILILYSFIISIGRLIQLDGRGLTEGARYKVFLGLVNNPETLDFDIKRRFVLLNENVFGRNSVRHKLNAPYVSGKHFKIFKEDDDYFLEDLISSNGTILNNKKIRKIEKLYNGDIIKIGELEFMFIDRR